MKPISTTKKRTPKLTVQLLHGENPDDQSVLIEGDARSLQFLAELIVDHIGASDCGFEVGPRGPGSELFTDKSTLGIYVHRLPCKDSKNLPKRKS